ncbi:MAG: ethanolamine ammonia lyase-activating protein [Deltaproteobacteria bacterium]|nr:ethanolamine ammonia lyase-activating protein [Deltaproteobacteria bacterium]
MAINKNIPTTGGWGSGLTSYDAFLQSEGIPVLRGLWVENILEAPLAPWKRKGGRGAYINLDGSGVNTSYIAIDAYVVEIPPGGSLNPEHYVYDEMMFVLRGRGATTVWTPERGKQTFEWHEGSFFAIPLNASHQLFNGDRNEPASLVGFSFAPTMINLLHNDEFIFNNTFAFTDRYQGEDDYFQGAGKFLAENWLDTNFIEDVRGFGARGPSSPEQAGSGDEPALLYIEMGCNTMSAHIMAFPVGTYGRAHRHEPGAHILILSGHGYSLHWLEGEEPMRIDWKPGSLFAPPDQWFHQHFNAGPTPAKYIAFKPRSRKFRTKGKFMNNVSRKLGGTLIEYEDEDPSIRALYERECARNGVRVNMREVPSD